MAKCEHLQIITEGNLAVGTCRCQECGKVMPLSEGYNCLLDAMRKRIREMDMRFAPIVQNQIGILRRLYRLPENMSMDAIDEAEALLTQLQKVDNQT